MPERLRVKTQDGTDLGEVNNLIFPDGSALVSDADGVEVTFSSDVVVYASSVSGVVLDGVYSTAVAAATGTDNTAALQAVLDTASSSTSLTLVIDGRAVVTGLRVKSNTTITGRNEGDGLILQDDSLRAVVANYNRTPVPASRVDANITIQNLTIDGNFFGNNDGTTNGGRYEVDGETWKVGLQFCGVTNLKLHSVHVRQARTFGIHVGCIDGFFTTDVRVTHTNDTAIHNNDGMHINGNSNDITLIKTYVEHTTDDAIAINADDGYNILGPHFEAGPIEHVRIYDTTFKDCFYGFRLISNLERLDDVIVYNSWARVSEYFARVDNLDSYFENTNLGNIGTIKFYGIHGEGFSSGEPGADGQQGSAEFIRIEARADHLAFMGIERNGLTWHPDWRAIVKMMNGQTEVWTSNGSHVKLLEIEYYDCHPAGTDYTEAQSPSGNQAVVIRGPVDKLIIKAHTSIDSSLSPFRGILQLDTNDVDVGVGEAIISGWGDSLINTVVVTTGKLDHLRLENFTDLNNGGVTLLVNNSADVGNIKFWHTDLELGGGTMLTDPGAKVTDMTSSGGSGSDEMVRATNASGTQTINSATITSVTFATEAFDTNALHSTSSNTSRLTAAISGKYLVTGGVQWSIQTLGTVTVLAVFLAKNGTVIDGTRQYQAPIAGFGTFGQGIVSSTLIDLAAGDYVEIQVYHDKTAAGTLTIDLAQSSLQMFYVG